MEMKSNKQEILVGALGLSHNNEARTPDLGSNLVDKEYIKRCLSLSYEERLKELERLNKFIFETMPEDSKKAWERLKKSGY
jgi:hypothetical protein